MNHPKSMFQLSGVHYTVLSLAFRVGGRGLGIEGGVCPQLVGTLIEKICRGQSSESC